MPCAGGLVRRAVIDVTLITLAIVVVVTVIPLVRILCLVFAVRLVGAVIAAVLALVAAMLGVVLVAVVLVGLAVIYIALITLVVVIVVTMLLVVLLLARSTQRNIENIIDAGIEPGLAVDGDVLFDVNLGSGDCDRGIVAICHHDGTGHPFSAGSVRKAIERHGGSTGVGIRLPRVKGADGPVAI